MRRYVQLSRSVRVKISRLRVAGKSISEIARKIGFNKSTVSRELRRNGDTQLQDHRWFKELAVLYQDPVMLARARKLPDRERTFHYSSSMAQERHRWRRYFSNQTRTRKSNKIRSWVIRKLRQGLTPTQIAGRSRIDGPGKVSHETVYQIIYRDKKLKGDLHRLLPRFRKRKQRFNTRDYVEVIPDRVDIRERPRIVEKRQRLGDLEADLIVGYKSDGYVLVVVDRKSRQVGLQKLQLKSKLETLKALLRAIKKFPQAHTLTVDNGREFSAHRTLTTLTGVKVYFTTPYTSQERGTVENTNGIIRRTLPKQSSFTALGQARLNQIERAMNNRPRAVLGFLTPREVANI